MAFIPVYDGNPLRHIERPYVSWAIIAVNAIVFFFVQSGSIEDASYAEAVSFGLIPATFNHIMARPDDLAYVPDGVTLLTYSFLHGNIWHLLGNMVFLWVFADNVEDSLGHVRFLIFYLLCGVAAGLTEVLMQPASEAPIIGASGAIAGVVAAYLFLHPFAKVWILALGRIPLRFGALWVLGFWMLYQIYQAFTAGDEGVAWWTHLGGFVTGAVLVLFLRRRGVPLFGREVVDPEVGDVDGPGTRL